MYEAQKYQVSVIVPAGAVVYCGEEAKIPLCEDKLI